MHIVQPESGMIIPHIYKQAINPPVPLGSNSYAPCGPLSVVTFTQIVCRGYIVAAWSPGYSAVLAGSPSCNSKHV